MQLGWSEPLVALGVITFLVGIWAGSLRPFLRGSATEAAPTDGLVQRSARAWYLAQLRPLEARFLAAGIGPSAITFAQLIASPFVGLCFAQGWLFLGGWLVLASGSLDILDGQVARQSGRASRQGAFLDSVVDRYVEAATFFGLCWWLGQSALLLVVLLAFLGGQMVSYTRARAESLGITSIGGSWQRPERLLLLGFGGMADVVFDRLVADPLGLPSHGVLTVALVLLAVVANLTALGRARAAWSRLAADGEAV